MDETVARRKTGVAVLVFTSFLLVGIIPLVIVSYVSTEASKRVQEQSVIDKLLAVSGRQFDLIEDFGREKLKNLESISTMPFVVEFAEAIADQETNVIALSDYVQWRSLMEKFRGLY